MLRSGILSASATAIMVLAMVPSASAQRLLEKDGIELRGTARIVTYAAGKCNVLEASHAEAEYERMKANHGQPLDVWQLDFSVHNGSGKWLDHLIARYGIESKWPDCTNWSGPSGTYPEPVQWASTLGNIQKSGRNVVAPDTTLTATTFILALHEDQPRFENWSVDYRFAARSGGVDPPPPAPGVPSAARQPSTQTSAEQENLFWQSIMNSKDSAEFEAYLAQFPEGVFRKLAETRLASLRATAGDTELPRTGTELGSAAARGRGDETLSPGQAFQLGADAICVGATDATPCWKELASHPGCYVWDDFYPTDLYLSELYGEHPRDYVYHHLSEQSVTWSGECSGGLASGTGTLKWVRKKTESDFEFPHTYEAGEHESTGLLRGGRANGHWVLFRRVVNEYAGRFSFEQVEEGPYADGKRHGAWTLRYSQADGFGYVDQGLFVHGRKHGNWIKRFPDGESDTVTFVNGKRQ